MAFNLQNFLANGLVLGGARPALFQVDIFPPFQTASARNFSFLCCAASMPEFIVQPATCAYFGAIVKFSGERVVGDWSVQIYNDEDFAQRAIMEKWSNAMNTLISNRLDPAFYPTAYKGAAEITQFGKDGRILRRYRMSNLWPVRVSDIPLSWEAATQIERFEVNFALDYFEPILQTSSDVFNPILDGDGPQETDPQLASNLPIFADQ